MLSDGSGPWLALVRRVIEEVADSDLAELELSQPGFRLRLRRRPDGAVESEPGPRPAAQGTPVTAPFTGLFYRAASPTAEPYVHEGDWVEAGATVGLIETMKIFNEVQVEQAGRVERVLAESGQLVHAGDPLLLLIPGPEPDGSA